MQQKLEIDYPSYALSFFRRRLNYVFDKMNVHKLQDFNEILDDREKRDLVMYYMSVPATEMFRDPAFWRTLRKLLQGRKEISIWFPDLASGDELYSMMILLRQLAISKVRVVANCTSQKAIDCIKTRAISTKTDPINRSNFERLESGDNFDNYVTVNAEQIELKPEVIQGVEFRKAWFMNEHPEKYDLIIFRNVLLNYGPQLNDNAMRILYKSLNDKGLLTIGIKETIGQKTQIIHAINANEGIYGLS